MTSVSYTYYIDYEEFCLVSSGFELLFFYYSVPLGSAQEIPNKLKLLIFTGDAKS